MKVLLAKAWHPVFAQIDLKEVLIKLVDGSGTPVVYTVKIGEGNLTYTEARNIEYTLDRGLLDEVREGDQIPMDVSLDANWEYITGGSDTSAIGTVEDFMKKRGVYASNVSTDSDSCRPYAIDILVEYEPNCVTVVRPQEDITLSDFRWESVAHDLRAGTLSFTGKCNVTEAVATRHDA
jgi:hypothetical protein